MKVCRRLEMKEAIGLFLLFSAVLLGCIFLFGLDLDLKDKVKIVIGGEVFLALLVCGTYLLNW